MLEGGFVALEPSVLPGQAMLFGSEHAAETGKDSVANSIGALLRATYLAKAHVHSMGPFTRQSRGSATTTHSAFSLRGADMLTV